MLIRINFTKMVGSGNDFIVIDNRNNIFPSNNIALIKHLCDRCWGIGADGIILIEKSVNDFKMRILNSDASEAEMCGNGARCAAYFAYTKKIAGATMKFDTLAGLIEATVIESDGKSIVKVKMIEPHSMQNLSLELPVLGTKEIFSINTGVPHAVIFVDDIKTLDVQHLGSFVRYHRAFEPKGTNVNFVKIDDEQNIIVRTYERGVEAETLACGSGSTASALAAAIKLGAKSPVAVTTTGGEILKIYFSIDGDTIHDVYLEGFVDLVFEGNFKSE